MTAEDLKKWRNENGYSQSRLAERLNVATMTISRWETGARTIPSFLLLALKALECERKTGKENEGGKYLPQR